MSQSTVFGGAGLTTHFKVTKADGRERFYRVKDDKHEEIPEAVYRQESQDWKVK